MNRNLGINVSTINNIPFDINRTPVEKNARVKPGGTTPVYHSEKIHPVSRNDKNAERRKGDDRRKQLESNNKNTRLLTERREGLIKKPKAEQELANAHISGGIIDLEV